MSNAEMPEAFRNVIRVIADAARRRSGHDIGRLLEQSLGKALVHDARKQQDSMRPDDWDHIADWLAAAVHHDLPWLRNVDADGVPRKFMKISGVKSLHEEAVRGFKRLAAEKRGVSGGDAEIETVAELAGGWTIVRLKDAAALDEESDEMQHCVGEGAYDIGIRSGELSIYSLRDAAGKPHATLEVHEDVGVVWQLRGKQNKFPISRYFEMLMPWIEERGLRIAESELAGGYAMVDGRVRHLTTLEAGETVFGDLLIKGDGSLGAITLPEGLTVNGALRIEGLADDPCAVLIGTGVSIGGEARLLQCRTDGLHNLAVGGEIVLRGGSVGEVAPGSIFRSKTELFNCEYGGLLENGWFEDTVDITGGPAINVSSGFGARMGLKLVGVPSVTFEDGVVVAGKVSVHGGYIEPECRSVSIGRDVTFLDDVWFDGGILSAPHGVTAKGCVTFNGATFAEQPGPIKAGKLHLKYVAGIDTMPSLDVDGDVSIYHSDVKSLGMNTVFRGSLMTIKSQIAHLPFGLKVADTLDVSQSALKAFPEEMYVGKDLVVGKCATGTIPGDAVIKRSVILRGNQHVVLPPNFRCFGSLDLNGARLLKEPKNVAVFDMLHLPTNPMTRVGAHFVARSYVLTGATVHSLQDLFDVPENLWIDAKDIGRLPEGMRVGGKMIVSGTDFGGMLPEGISIGRYLAVENADDPQGGIQVVDGDCPIVPVSAVIGEGVRVRERLVAYA